MSETMREKKKQHGHGHESEPEVLGKADGTRSIEVGGLDQHHQGDEHSVHEHLEHATHTTHGTHLAVEKAAKALEGVSEGVEYVEQITKARELQVAHNTMSRQLHLMRRGCHALEQQSRGARKIPAQLKAQIDEGRAVLTKAEEAFAAERPAVNEASQLLRSMSHSKLRIGEYALKFEKALEHSAIGRQLLKGGKIITSEAFVHGLMVIGAAMEGVTAYMNSPTQTQGGKVAHAALAAGGGALVMANPLVATADLLTPKGYKLSEVYQGGATAISAIGEGIVTGNTTAAENFHEASKAGEYGKVMQASSEAGDYWAEHGIAGGAKEFAHELSWWWNNK